MCLCGVQLHYVLQFSGAFFVQDIVAVSSGCRLFLVLDRPRIQRVILGPLRLLTMPSNSPGNLGEQRGHPTGLTCNCRMVESDCISGLVVTQILDTSLTFQTDALITCRGSSLFQNTLYQSQPLVQFEADNFD